MFDSRGCPVDLEHEARRLDFPKWSTLCRLRCLGFPTLEAVFVAPDQANRIDVAAGFLAARLGGESLLVRSDGGIERTAYFVGGSTHALDQAVQLARRLLESGRAVLLMEPTNRFSNHLTANIRIDQHRPGGAGALTVEILGPGYDVGDLTRGGITPEVTLELPVRSWQRFDPPWLTDFRISRRSSVAEVERRRTQRLQRIAHTLLPSTGAGPGHRSPADAAQWLKGQGMTGLWERLSIDRVLRRTKRWYEDAFVVANNPPSRIWSTLGLSMSDLGRREVFWDIVDGARKYAHDRPGTLRAT